MSKELNFRTLTVDEVEVKPQTLSKSKKTCLLAIYKDARVDMKLLDEIVGPYNWRRTHRRIGNELFCTVEIWDDEKKEWIAKEDVGTPSQMESAKGEASDAFKRACVNIGIGRELYTGPKIRVYLTPDDFFNDKLSTKFHVTEMEITEGVISHLVIHDENNKERFRFPKGGSRQAPKKQAPAAKQPQDFVMPKKNTKKYKYLEAVYKKLDFVARDNGYEVDFDRLCKFIYEVKKGVIPDDISAVDNTIAFIVGRRLIDNVATKKVNQVTEQEF